MSSATVALRGRAELATRLLTILLDMRGGSWCVSIDLIATSSGAGRN
jgi:hypothetical protein